MVSSQDIAYLAGLLEGEGTFDNTKSQPRIRVGSLDQDVIERATKLLNGCPSISRTPKGKTFYITTVCGQKAAAWMMTLYIFLGKRRKSKVHDVLPKWRSVPRPGHHPNSIRSQFTRGRRHGK